MHVDGSKTILTDTIKKKSVGNGKEYLHLILGAERLSNDSLLYSLAIVPATATLSGQHLIQLQLGSPNLYNYYTEVAKSSVQGCCTQISLNKVKNF